MRIRYTFLLLTGYYCQNTYAFTFLSDVLAYPLIHECQADTLPQKPFAKMFSLLLHNNMLKGRVCWLLAALLLAMVSAERLTFTIVTAVYGKAEGTPVATQSLCSATTRSPCRKT